MKRAVIFIAEGFEEIEALSVVDYLRPAGRIYAYAIGTDNRMIG